MCNKELEALFQGLWNHIYYKITAIKCKVKSVMSVSLSSKHKNMCLLPQSFPAPPRKTHLGQPSPLHLLDTTLLPVPALIVDLLLARVEIRLPGVDQLCPLDDLPEHVHKGAKPEGKVRRDEGAHVKGSKRIEADEQDGHAAEEQGQVGRVRGEGGEERQRLGVHALGLAGAVEADEGDHHHGVGHDECRGGQVDEPEEDLDGRVGRDEEGDARDERHGQHAVERHALLGAVEQELGRLVVARQAVERA